MTTEATVKDEVRDLRRRVSALERLVFNLVTIEPTPRSKLSSQQKKLLGKTISDIEKADYRDYFTVGELRKIIKD